MISEEITRRIDSTGRVSIPKYLRNKFKCVEGAEVAFYTHEENGETFICIKVVEWNFVIWNEKKI